MFHSRILEGDTAHFSVIDVLKKRAQKIQRRLKKKVEGKCHLSIVPTVSRVGGGALPEVGIDSWALNLKPTTIKLSVLERSEMSA